MIQPQEPVVYDGFKQHLESQLEAIRECLKLGTRVTWASPV